LQGEGGCGEDEQEQERKEQVESEVVVAGKWEMVDGNTLV
jgi:hypothetical protein